jgi:hypothetical protein
MEESQLPEEERKEDESLADVPLSPIPPDHGSLGARLAKGVLVLGALGAGAFVLLTGFTTPCLGATRSSKLKWEQRQLEIEQAEHDAQSVVERKS